MASTELHPRPEAGSARRPGGAGTRARRDAVLAAARSATAALLRSGSSEASLRRVLEEVGRATGVARSVILRNTAPSSGGVLATIQASWTEGIDDVDALGAATYDPDWAAELSSGRPVASRGARFVAIAPIFAGPTWWGSLRLDAQGPRTSWHTAEMDALQIVADVLGAAIHREQTEQTHREATFVYRQLVESVPSMVTYMDRVQPDDAGTSIPLYISPQIGDLLGYPRDAWLTDDELWLQVLHPDDADRMTDADRNARGHLQPLSAEYRMVARDGRTVWVGEKSAVVQDDDSGTLYWQGVMVDITERKRIEDELITARRKLLDQTVRAGEEERQRLAAELHDGPVQRLVRLGYMLERVSLQLERQDPHVGRELLDRAKDALRTEIQGLRTMMTELRPPVLDQIGLGSALRDLGGHVERTSSVRCAVDDAFDGRLAPSLETVLYRVAQEALMNVVKHAEARNVRISLRTEPGHVVLEVRDDGTGFDPTPAAAPLGNGEHLGLSIMRERVEMAGGRWSLDSTTGSGTTIRAAIPMGLDGAS